jgi:tetratricopeptide (TPR) repeat protein
MDQFHSDDFLLYAYLQSGQDEQARSVVLEAMAAMDHYKLVGNMDMGEHGFMDWMFPRYRTNFPMILALESRDWKGAAALEPVKDASPSTQTDTYWGRTIADGHLRDATHARADVTRYDALMEEAKKGDAETSNSAGNRIQRGEMLGWVAFAEGNTAEAVKQLRAAADLQDQVGQGEVDIPAREMLADVLLESSQPQQALIEYEQDLKRNPNRFYGLFNAGRAAEMANQPFVAREYYAALLKSTHDGAQSTRPELAQARAFVSTLSR